jgi:Fe2+ transport system protein FeoA
MNKSLGQFCEKQLVRFIKVYSAVTSEQKQKLTTMGIEKGKSVLKQGERHGKIYM